MPKILDLMEYPDDEAAQAAYPTNADFLTVFEDDFENNNLDKWTIVEAAWSTTDAQKYSGTYSAYGVGQATLRTLSKTLPSALTKARLVFYVRFSKATVNEQNYYLVYDPPYALVARKNHFQYYNGSYHNLPTDTTWVINTWYKIRVDFDASTNSLKYWINDDYKGEVTSIAFASVTAIFLISNNTATYNMWVDDVVMKDLNTKCLQCYSESTIKQQGNYSLKGIAKQLYSLDNTLTRTVSPTIDLTGKNKIRFQMYASRIGSNIKVGIRDSGDQITEITPNIALADTWQMINWSIVNLAKINKDAIDRIFLTMLNVDSDNIFYIDDMQAYAVAQSPILV